MKKTAILFTILLSQISVFAQNQKGRKEFSLPLHPWILLTGTYYLQYEQFHNPTRSTTATIGYNNTGILFMWSKVNYQGYRGDIGQRWYLRGSKAKYVRPFAGVNATFEYSNLKLQKDYSGIVPSDSLQAKGFSFAPEINAGIKFVAFKKITFTSSLGLRYYVNTINENKLTNNPQYWAYNDWDNPNPDWRINRQNATLNGYRKGFLPIPYINFGFVLRL